MASRCCFLGRWGGGDGGWVWRGKRGLEGRIEKRKEKKRKENKRKNEMKRKKFENDNKQQKKMKK